MRLPRLIELVGEWDRFGCPRCTPQGQGEGIQANHNRIYRGYSDAALSVRRWTRRRGVAVERQGVECMSGPSHVWSMDFVSDALASCCRVKVLTNGDDVSNEAIDVAVDFGI